MDTAGAAQESQKSHLRVAFLLCEFRMRAPDGRKVDQTWLFLSQGRGAALADWCGPQRSEDTGLIGRILDALLSHKLKV